MAFDGIAVSNIVYELKNKLEGGRIDKIYQPAAEEIILNIHCGQEKYRLFISANTSHASIYLLDENGGGNPQNPPAFCMLL